MRRLIFVLICSLVLISAYKEDRKLTFDYSTSELKVGDIRVSKTLNSDSLFLLFGKPNKITLNHSSFIRKGECGIFVDTVNSNFERYDYNGVSVERNIHSNLLEYVHIKTQDIKHNIPLEITINGTRIDASLTLTKARAVFNEWECSSDSVTIYNLKDLNSSYPALRFHKKTKRIQEVIFKI